MTTQVVDLGFRPRDWQVDVYKRMKRFNVLVVHRRAGKTVLAVMYLIHRALKCALPEGRYAYVAPEFKQAKAVAWDYLKRFTVPIPGAKVNESECYVELPNGSRIRIYGADDPDRLRGIYLDGVVPDEIADMKPAVWGEVIRPALADRKGWALFIGTPKGINLLSELFYAAQSDPDWFALRLTINDTNAIDAAEIEASRKQMSENQFAQEFLCDFSAGNTSSLLSANDVEEASRRVYRVEEFDHAARILGIDVARQGDDRTAIIRRQGLMSWPAQTMRGADAMEVAAQAARAIVDWKPHSVFIDGSGGYGAGVIDRLRQLGHVVTEVQFGGKPDDDRFANKRTEMWWHLAEWVKNGGALHNDPAMKLDLCAPTYNHRNVAGKTALESKDEIKKRGLPSPDIGDALALTFAYPVATPGLVVDGIVGLTATSERAVVDWDPFASR